MIILDLDGTIADNSHREHLIPKEKGTTDQWTEFNLACGGDYIIPETYEVLNAIYWHTGHSVYVVTGRSEVCLDETVNWLAKNAIHYDLLIMRPEDDHRKAVEFKREKFEELGLCEEDIVFEDDPAIINMIHKEFKSIVVTVPSKCSAVLIGASQEGSEQK